MKPSLLYLENMSAILLKTNGKASSSKPTRHMNIKFFFSKEKNDNVEVRIKHCPTKQMWTDINTKPKQGAVHQKFRGHVNVMSILANYIDTDYKSAIPLTEPKSMIPITKAQLALLKE